MAPLAILIGMHASGVAAVLSARPAWALERTRTQSTNVPVRRPAAPVHLRVDAEPELPELSPAAVLAGLQASAARWSQVDNPCTGMSVQIETDRQPQTEAAIDQVNRLVIRRDRWCSPGSDDPGCRNPHALAITTTTARKSDGVLVDADIEVNATGAPFRDLLAEPDAIGGHDLDATLTHEIGHLLGFDHSCRAPGETAGSAIPSCASADPAALASVMFPTVSSLRQPRRDPTPDDRQALCQVYPLVPGIVEGFVPGCSAAGERRRSAASALLPLAALALLVRLPGRLGRSTGRLRRRGVEERRYRRHQVVGAGRPFTSPGTPPPTRRNSSTACSGLMMSARRPCGVSLTRRR